MRREKELNKMCAKFGFEIENYKTLIVIKLHLRSVTYTWMHYKN